jgi:hypothetical protein
MDPDNSGFAKDHCPQQQGEHTENNKRSQITQAQQEMTDQISSNSETNCQSIGNIHGAIKESYLAHVSESANRAMPMDLRGMLQIKRIFCNEKFSFPATGTFVEQNTIDPGLLHATFLFKSIAIRRTAAIHSRKKFPIITWSCRQKM